MDPTGLLDAVLAVAVYPGGLFVMIAALLHRAVAGRGPASRSGAPLPVATRALVPVIAAVVGAAMLPLSGSPALQLPPSAGATGNLLVLIALLAVAADVGSGSRLAALVGAGAAVGALALASAAHTLSLPAVVSGGGPPTTAARALVSATLAMAAAAPPPGGARSSAVVRAVLSLAAAAFVVPSALGSAPPVVVAAVCLGGVAVVAALGRATARLSPALVTGAALVATLAAATLALLSGRV